MDEAGVLLRYFQVSLKLLNVTTNRLRNQEYCHILMNSRLIICYSGPNYISPLNS